MAHTWRHDGLHDTRQLHGATIRPLLFIPTTPDVRSYTLQFTLDDTDTLVQKLTPRFVRASVLRVLVCYVITLCTNQGHSIADAIHRRERVIGIQLTAHRAITVTRGYGRKCFRFHEQIL